MKLSRMIALVPILVAALAGTAFGAPALPTPLFEPADASALAAGRTTVLEPNVVRRRFVQLAPAELGAEIRLNLFDNVDVRVSRRSETSALGARIWNGVPTTGAIDGDVILLARVGNAMAGNFWIGNGRYQLRYRGNGIHELSEVRRGGYPREGCTPPEPEVAPRPASTPSAVRSVAADPSSVIDILVLYTPAARDENGDVEGIEALIHLAISAANLSFDRSDVNPRYSPVHIAETDYVEAGIEDPDDETADAFRDRDRLRDPDDGFMDEAHVLRETYCADIVHLITANGGGWCGAAYTMNTPMDPAHEANAFATTQDSCAVDNFTFAHEMGHTLGAQHDWYTTADSTPWVYSHAHINRAEGWRTIMAYDDFCDDAGPECERIGYWSNPNRFYQGQPLGVPEGTDNSCVADNLANPMCDAENYRVINNNAATAANFRQRQTCIASPSHNVWMKDTWADTGLQPDPNTAGQKMWKSPYIWVRNQFDGTGAYQHVHQNPEAGSTNYVYAKLHNDFDVPASGQLKLYYAEASTGLVWPADWTEFSTGAVNIGAHATLLVPRSWTPPGTGHYCLLARWATPTAPSDPMAVPEGAAVSTNVRNNNNIVWRNVNVVDVVPNVPYAVPDLKVKNTDPSNPFVTLAVQLPDFGGNLIRAGGRVFVDLGTAFGQWNSAGANGSDIAVVTLPGFGNVVEILDSTAGGGARIERLSLAAGVNVAMRLIVKAPVVRIPPNFPGANDDPPETQTGGGPTVPAPPVPTGSSNVFGIDVVQYQGALEIGGVGYEVVVEPTSPGVGAVPDGATVPGVPLTIGRVAGGGLQLSWGASCQASDTDYAIYSGTLGAFAGHLPEVCTTSGATTMTLPPPQGNTYYLVVPNDGAADGSYGVTSTGAERPESEAACRLRVAVPCPAR